MRNSSNIKKIVFISISTVLFILLYSYLTVIGYRISVIMGIGLCIIIFVLLYFFSNLFNSCIWKSNIKFKSLNDIYVKISLVILSYLVNFIDPIDFSIAIISWKQISLLNYFRAIIVIISCFYVVGSFFFNMFFFRIDIKKYFKVEPFLFKITFYPLISISFIGSVTFFLDFFGLNKQFFSVFLLFIITSLFLCETIIRIKFRKESFFKKKSNQIKLSRSSLLISILALGIVLIAVDIHLSSLYLIPGDSWRGINYAYYVGVSGTQLLEETFCGTYTIYWGYISFGLSAMGGLPYININVFLLPFLYIFVISSYILIKVLLNKSKESYAILATIFVLFFSEFLYNMNSDYNRISNLIFDGTLCFRYKSFSLFSTITGMIIYIGLLNMRRDEKKIDSIRDRNRSLPLISICAFLIGQSFLTYFLHFILALSLFVLITLLYLNKNNLKLLFQFLLIFTIFFIIFDLFSRFFFGFISTNYLLSFLVGYFNRDENLLLGSVIFYSLLISAFIFILGLNYAILKLKEGKGKLKASKKIFILFFIIILFLLIFDLVFVNILNKNDNLLTYYLDLIISNLGLIGLIASVLLFFSYKQNKIFFLLNLLWVFLILVISSIVIFNRSISYNFASPLQFNQIDFSYMMQWFNRIWCFSIYPVSILASIGLIEFLKKLNNCRFNVKLNEIHRAITKNIFICGLIFSLVTPNIISGIYWYYRAGYISNEDAYVMGWINKNIPTNSSFIESVGFLALEDIVYCQGYKTKNFYNALEEIATTYDIRDQYLGYYTYFYQGSTYEGSNFSFNYGLNNEIKIIKSLDNHSNFLELKDNYHKSNITMKVELDSELTYGYISFSIKKNTITSQFRINFLSSQNNEVFSLVFDNSSIFGLNNTKFIEIDNILNNTWYNISIRFNCLDHELINLKEYSWGINLEGLDYSNYSISNNLTNIKKIIFSTNNQDFNYSFYIDDLYISLYPEFNWENIYLYTPALINFAQTNNFEYLIIKQEMLLTYYDLIMNYFSTDIFQSKNFVIYKATQ